MLDQLVKTIISLSKFNNLIPDKFFYDKFGNKIRDLLTNCIFLLRESGDGAAQYRTGHEKVTGNINDILEMFEDLKYLNLLKTSPLFLQVQKNLLTLELQVIIHKNKTLVLKPEKTVEKIEEKPADKSKGSTLNLQKGRTSVKESLRLNQSKKKILEFIKSYPNIRTKDIINEFNALSDRTVKRNLMDLLRIGLIKKKVDNKAVYYYSSSNEVQPTL